jgi:hypothetical protein
MQSLRIIEKVSFILLHLFQVMVSWEGLMLFSGIFALFLMGMYFLDRDYFKSTFGVSPWVISIIGSVIWFSVALIEA